MCSVFGPVPAPRQAPRLPLAGTFACPSRALAWRYFHPYWRQYAIYSYLCNSKTHRIMLVKLYNDSPNEREISRIVDVLNQGGIIVIPTDTLYAFACRR